MLTLMKQYYKITNFVGYRYLVYLEYNIRKRHLQSLPVKQK